MSDKARLIRIRQEIMGALDEKFKDVPEWRWFRDIDQMLAEANGASDHSPVVQVPHHGRQSYGNIAIALIEGAGRPIPTDELVAFIANKRDRNPAEIKSTVQSMLSRDDRLQSVHWSGGRGWWLANREVPR